MCVFTESHADCVDDVCRVRLLGVNGKHDEGDKPQETMLKCYIDNMTDLNVKALIEEKLRDVDSKNDTIHVRYSHL